MAFKWNFKNLRKQAVNNKAKFHEYVSCSSNEYSSQQTLNTLYLFIYRKTWKYIYVVDNWFITGKTKSDVYSFKYQSWYEYNNYIFIICWYISTGEKGGSNTYTYPT